MNVIALRKLRIFWQQHPSAERSLRVWYKRLRKLEPQNFAELRVVFASADLVKRDGLDDLTVFNVGGNKFRVIVVLYRNQTVFVKHVFTHLEYTIWNKGGKPS